MFMVAERAVTQGLNDLRGELGVKFHEIENGDSGLKSLLSKITDIQENFENLNDKITNTSKNNNALLRNEILAMKGGIAQESAATLEQQLNNFNEKVNN